MTYRQAVEWLYAQQLHGIKLGLETMQRLCGELAINVAPSDTERQEPSELGSLNSREISNTHGERPFYIHVAGTNGKGSVCAMLDAIYRAAGFRTGLYTSPHLVTFRERIRLDGEMIPERDVAEGLSRIRSVTDRWEVKPTFFEIATALALDWFQDRRAHVAILETGLGGRLDATNVVNPVVSVLTPISLDHEKYLGSTIEAIAREKCGIIKPGVPVVSASQSPEAGKVIQTWAVKRGSKLSVADPPFPPEVSISLPGPHQRANAAVAWNTIEVAQCEEPFLTVATPALVKGLANVQWPGRFQRIGQRYVLDGAHNPAAAEALAQAWRDTFGEQKATLILGVMRDKNVRGVIAALAPIAERIFTVQVNNARSLNGRELEGEVRQCVPGVDVLAAASLADALKRAEAGLERILIAGSLFLVGEALVALGVIAPEPERSDQ